VAVEIDVQAANHLISRLFTPGNAVNGFGHVAFRVFTLAGGTHAGFTGFRRVYISLAIKSS
jgi:hypothetical protein